ncbi:MAG: PEP/pyruvate-binding domain-containing protein [Floccifex sp.]
MEREKILSGLAGLDKKLDCVRCGDNIVFRVLDLEYFRFFARQFVFQSLHDQRDIHYIRFGEHKPMIEKIKNVFLHQLDPNEGFESFSVHLYRIALKANEKSLFVFDNISILSDYWNTDLMLGNFINVMCPIFTQRNHITLIPVRRGAHSYDCINQIRESVQIFLDVFYDVDHYYLTPLKVENRYNSEMFLTHRIDEDKSFHPMTYSTSLAKYYAAVEQSGPGEQLQDSWDRFFSNMQLNYSKKELTPPDKKKMCSMLMTDDERMQALIIKNFKYRDFIQVHSRMIGTGKIGGKAVGMLTATKIIIRNCEDIAPHIEPHDSYFVGSDIFYTYIIHNQFWDLWLQHKANPENMELAKKIQDRLLEGKFPVMIAQQFKRMIDYYGTCPIIVRSSSFLEDGFGNAFAGKYESVFCVSGKTLEDRLKTFEKAVRIVYASTMSQGALEYRRRRNLLDSDEQMALLIQRVSGSRLGNYYFPMAAGVGYSYNSYPWSDELDPNAGMLRLVAGLGTRAVDRTPGDYPRLVNLDKPLMSMYSSSADRHKYSQRKMDVISFESNDVSHERMETILPYVLPWQKQLLFSHDTDAEWHFRDRGQYREVLFLDCQQLIKNQEIMSTMQTILKTLQREYQTPVDIEYTINVSQDNEYFINLLQCRPLQANHSTKINLPTLKHENIFFEIEKNLMGTSRNEYVDVIVYVDPYAYYTMEYVNKPKVARAIGKINQVFKDKGYHLLLITPGRIGTSSPELGVPVSFAEISEFNAIMEVAYSKVGYMPELSFGSHMFQDLVEAQILYIACMENSQTKVYNVDFLKQFEDISASILNDEMMQIISVYKADQLLLVYDDLKRKIICGKE